MITAHEARQQVPIQRRKAIENHIRAAIAIGDCCCHIPFHISRDEWEHLESLGYVVVESGASGNPLLSWAE